MVGTARVSDAALAQRVKWLQLGGTPPAKPSEPGPANDWPPQPLQATGPSPGRWQMVKE